jgi:hypothetical protein
MLYLIINLIKFKIANITITDDKFELEDSLLKHLNYLK